MVLPEGFKLAPKDRMEPELKKKMKGFTLPYSPTQENMLVVGPIDGAKHRNYIPNFITSRKR